MKSTDSRFHIATMQRQLVFTQSKFPSLHINSLMLLFESITSHVKSIALRIDSTLSKFKSTASPESRGVRRFYFIGADSKSIPSRIQSAARDIKSAARDIKSVPIRIRPIRAKMKRVAGHTESPVFHIKSPTHHLKSPTHHVKSPTHDIKSPTHHLKSPTHHLKSQTHHVKSRTHHLKSPTHHAKSATHHIKSPTHLVAPTRDVIPPLTSRDKGTTHHSKPGEIVVNSSHTSTLNTLTRVQRFLDQNKSTLGDINSSGYRTILDDVVAKLAAHAGDQTTSKRVAAGATAKERVLRNALKLNHMRPIATVAAAQLRQVPDFAALKMPPLTSTSRSLIATAAAMREAASAYTDAFLGAGLPPDFLDKLQAASDTLASALTSRNANSAAQRGATVGLDTETIRGRQAVKVLNSLVEPLIAGDLPLLAQWTAAKRFGGRAALPADTSIDAAASGPATSAAKNAAASNTPTPSTEVVAPSSAPSSSPSTPSTP